jgi:23S rRNA G2445 N2-methylase RlmL
MMDSTLRVTSAPGLEDLLRDEIRELGLPAETEPAGTVRTEGAHAAAARILVRSRIASRVLLPLKTFSAKTSAMLYDQVRRIDWPGIFSPELSMAVDVRGSLGDARYALSFAPLKIKDAICDEFRKRELPRPNVDRVNPDVRIAGFYRNGRCALSLDLSGAPLHRRGYRREGGEAPLRENRAAALLRFAGYDGSKPLVDPFCGSGTIPIEAALIALRVAPGLLRPVEAFTLARLSEEGRAALTAERARAEAERLDAPVHAITGRDVAEETLAIARDNARKAGVEHAVRFERGDARALEAPQSFIVSNPPYGERLAETREAAELLRAFTRQVKHASAGSTLGLVVPRGPLEKAIGFRPDERLEVESGPLGLRYLRFAIYAGSRKTAE